MFLDFNNLPAEEQAAIRAEANGMLFAAAPQLNDASEDVSPSDVQNEQVLLIASISLGLSFIATIYPAWRVSKTSPAEVLKY